MARTNHTFVASRPFRKEKKDANANEIRALDYVTQINSQGNARNVVLSKRFQNFSK